MQCALADWVLVDHPPAPAPSWAKSSGTTFPTVPNVIDAALDRVRVHETDGSHVVQD
jgi:hypothetical protein